MSFNSAMDNRPPEPVLSAVGLTIKYLLSANRSITAVNSFSMDLMRGEIVGIVGETGSGKSTAALGLMGLVRGRGVITAGRVLYDNVDILRLGEKRLRDIRGMEICAVFQNPKASLNPLLPVGRQIMNVIRSNDRMRRNELQQLAVEALRAVGIADPARRASAYPHEISGGMAQRVMIAMATVNKPSVLIADEPTTGLDVTVRAQILDLLRARVDDVGSAAILVSHDLAVIAHYCDRAIVMRESEIVETAPVTVLFREPSEPYSQKLIRAARDSTRL